MAESTSGTEQIELPEVDLDAANGTPAPASVEDVTEALKDVVDPELGINVVDLVLVYVVTLDEDQTSFIDMTLTSAACPLTDVIEDQTRTSLDGLVDDFRINWVWMPPWGPEKITDEGRDPLPGPGGTNPGAGGTNPRAFIGRFFRFWGKDAPGACHAAAGVRVTVWPSCSSCLTRRRVRCSVALRWSFHSGPSSR